VVQEALLRVHRALADGERIESPRAYVATIATRLAIDQLRSARARRESYVGDWLPEPLVVDPDADPARQAELADSLSLAFLVLLESLSPEQRAVLLLHDVFDYGYGEISEIVGCSEDNARQLATRARRHVDQRRPRFESSQAQREELARRFFAAARDGDLGALESLLADDVVLQGDGGGKAPRSPARCTAAAASRARCWRGCERARGFRTRRWSRPSSTASRARSLTTARAASSTSWRSRSRAATCRASARSSTRTSCATSGRWPTSRR
jgi:RNA polymerase sigma factor (sigma-70 family)